MATLKDIVMQIQRHICQEPIFFTSGLARLEMLQNLKPWASGFVTFQDYCYNSVGYVQTLFMLRGDFRPNIGLEANIGAKYRTRGKSRS